MPYSFGLITEGKTDQAVLKNILVGYFQDVDLYVRRLQPSDVTDLNAFGGWNNVFRYCESDFLIAAFDDVDFVIIHLDTDRAHEYGVTPYNRKEPIEDYIKRVQIRIENSILTQMTSTHYAESADRIIFAIAVDAIECWLLPLYYADKDSKKQAATGGCLYKLQQVLPNQVKLERKSPKEYTLLSEGLSCHAVFSNVYDKNPSFKRFMTDLATKVKNRHLPSALRVRTCICGQPVCFYDSYKRKGHF
jgi:hypothetical protein